MQAKNDDKMIETFRRTGKSVRQRPDPPTPKERAAVGIVAGMLMGLAYGLVSENINQYFMPGIPLAHPPLGLIGNLIFNILAGGVIGYLAGRPAHAITGIIASTVGIMVLLTLLILFAVTQQSVNTGQLTVNLLTLILAFSPMPIALPVIILLRWSIDLQHEHKGRPIYIIARSGPILATLIIAAAAGYFSLYSVEQRNTVIAMNKLLQQALSSGSQAELPLALGDSSEVKAFRQNASSDYTLELSSNRDLLANIESESGWPLHSLVIAKFDNGWVVLCGFPTDLKRPQCMNQQD
jgi:hypothetical protein